MLGSGRTQTVRKIAMSANTVPGITGGELKQGERWECPYCGMLQTLTEPLFASGVSNLKLGDGLNGRLAIQVVAVRCANSACDQTTVGASSHSWSYGVNCTNYSPILESYRLRPT